MTLEETWDYKGHLIKRKSRRLKQVSTWYPSHCYKLWKRSLLICLPLWEGFLDFSQHVWTLPCLLSLSYIWLSSDRCRHTPWASGFDLDLMIVIIEFRIGWLSAAPPSIACGPPVPSRSVSQLLHAPHHFFKGLRQLWSAISKHSY